MALLTNKHRRSSAAESDDKTMHWNSRHPPCKNVVVHRAWLSKLSTTADIIYVNMPGSNGDSFDSLGRVVGGWGVLGRTRRRDAYVCEYDSPVAGGWSKGPRSFDWGLSGGGGWSYGRSVGRCVGGFPENNL